MDVTHDGMAMIGSAEAGSDGLAALFAGSSAGNDAKAEGDKGLIVVASVRGCMGDGFRFSLGSKGVGFLNGHVAKDNVYCVKIMYLQSVFLLLFDILFIRSIPIAD
jgi:hypothetical protein